MGLAEKVGRFWGRMVDDYAVVEGGMCVSGGQDGV